MCMIATAPSDSLLITPEDKLARWFAEDSFELYKSNVCHLLKDSGDMPFIIDVLEHDRIRKLFAKGTYPQALYLLAMLDYLCRISDMPICSDFNDLRKCKLQKTIYPTGVLAAVAVSQSDDPIKKCEDEQHFREPGAGRHLISPTAVQTGVAI